MKKYDNIDDFFREEASDFQIIPSDKVWQNIEKEIIKPKSNHKGSLLLWMLAALIFALGGYLIWNTSNEGHQQKVIKNTTLVNKNKIENKTQLNSDKNSTKEIVTSNNKANIVINQSNNTINDIATLVEINENKPDFNQATATYVNISVDNTFGINLISGRSIHSLDNTSTPSLLGDFNDITIKKYLEEKKQRHFYTGASASIAITYYALSSDEVSWTTDLAYGMKLKNSYIESGIGFQKMKEQGVFQIDYKTNDSVGYYNKVVSFEVDPNNPNTITYKTQTTTVYDSIEHQLLKSPLYTYNYIVVPVKFGYKFYQKNGLSISAETGIIYSYLTHTYVPEVSYNEGNTQLIGISNNTPNRVEHNFRFHMALRFNYNIAGSINLSIQPEFTKYINSIYEQSSNNKARPYTMGIRFGIYFGF